ncbi:MAG TPA: PIN domain-containing protein [Candidatus Thermoplasmatota archaeon]|nr:PIN domain-containing protein [Candidatus Thermoplasmatota archaeon]
MRSLFVDTGPFVALASPRDRFHERAGELLRRIAAREWSYVTTSDFVLAETLNFVQRKIRRKDAMDRVMELAFGSSRQPPIVRDVQRVHAGRFASATHAMSAGFDRGLSFTDWTTIVVMREAGISEVATFEGGFGGVVGVAEV